MKFKGQDFYGNPPLRYVRYIVKSRKLAINPRDIFAYWQERKWRVDSLEDAVKIYYDITHPKPPKNTKPHAPKKPQKIMLSYAEQLTDPRWFAFRERALLAHGRRCERCGCSTGLQVHHKEYKSNKYAWQYKTKDVMILCDSCHARLHHKDTEAKMQERHLNSC